MVAVNIEPAYSLEEWEGFWKSTGAGDVLWAQDSASITIAKYRLVALGTEVLVDRQGLVAFRSHGPAGYGRLQAEIEKVL